MSTRITRRQALKAGAAAAAATALAPGISLGKAASNKPNFLFIIADQLGLDALSAHGCPDVHTPNIDRLIARGTTFMESHSTNPVCSPARSSLMTGCMATETGVITNGRPIHARRPNMGQWFSERGYQTVYCGKWHMPAAYPTKLPGFKVLPAGRGSGGNGDLIDTVVSRTSEAFLKSKPAKPFMMVTSLLQPHDICFWGQAMPADRHFIPPQVPFAQLAGKLPKLPPNHTARPKAPAALARRKFTRFVNDDQWRYYLYVYARQVEMLDADVGRVLDALEASGQAENTVVVFTSDHGDGRGRHQHVSKWYPYEEAVKVPLVVSGPALGVAQGLRDTTHLVSGVDIMRTFCDYAKVPPPPAVRGRSLRPLLEKKGGAAWRKFVVSDFATHGRMLRTDRYKYVHYKGDPVEQLFDMKADPWETKNLYADTDKADVLAAHRALLKTWEAGLKTVPPTGSVKKPRRRAGRKAKP